MNERPGLFRTWAQAGAAFLGAAIVCMVLGVAVVGLGYLLLVIF